MDRGTTKKEVDRIVQLERWAQELRDDLPITEIILAVKERMARADELDSYQLALILKGVLIEDGREGEAEQIIDQMMERYPEDVRFAIEKASLHLYFLDNPRKALECINEALTRAYRTGFFRREALGVKARILLKLGAGDELCRVLEDILSLKMMDECPDVGRERDFIDRAPAGLIPKDLLARYDSFCPTA